jgi:hypothetical protein
MWQVINFHRAKQGAGIRTFSAAVTIFPRPARQIALLMAMFLLINFSLAEVGDVALPCVECAIKQLDLLEGYGTAILDGYARSILMGHEIQCKLIVTRA